MALILNIDTSTETASICLAENATPLMIVENGDQKDHASWLHVAIRKMMNDCNRSPKDLQAIAVANGPGSYTGLRVGMAAAKGFCYALNIPLITEGTLNLLAFAVKDRTAELPGSLICPMIDARRMEVFAALFSADMKPLMPPTAMILDETSFAKQLSDHRVWFTGSGAGKWKNLNSSPNARFLDAPILADTLAVVANNKYLIKDFTDLIYSEPE